MKSLLAILAILVFAMTTSAEARDHRHRRHHGHDRHHDHHYDYHRHDHDHHHYRSSRPHCGYPIHGPSYRCRGGFMVWIPGVGYIFRSGHHHYCD